MAIAPHIIATVRAHRAMADLTGRDHHGRLIRGHRLGPRRPLPRQQHPKLIESDYARELVAIVDVRAAIKPLLDELPSLLTSARAARGDTAIPREVRLDANDTIRARQLIEQARRAIGAGLNPHTLDGLARRYAQATTRFQKEQLGRQVRAAIGVDIVTNDRFVPAMIEHFAAANAALIKSLANRSVDDIEKIVGRAFTTGARAEDVDTDIADRYGVTERHARMIARDQIGSLNGQVNASRQRELGIAKFVWRSMEDERVRPEHEVLDGQVFSYDDPPAEGLPGEPVLCRCGAEPVFDELLAQLAA